MRSIRKTIWATLFIIWMIAPIAQAQQQGEPPAPAPADQAAAPIPAYRSPLASAADNGDDGGLIADPNRLIPDTTSLTGAQTLSLGQLAGRHSFWQPHVDFTSTLSSNGLSSTTNTGWTTWSTIYGGIDLRRISGNSDLGLLYSGGASVSNDGSSNNGIIQNLEFVEKLAYRRATISILDQLSYLPENAFGSQFGNIGTPLGSGSIGLQPGLGLGPGQSILTASGQRLSNALVPEVDVRLTARTSLTFVGDYSVLHFFDNNLLNSYNAGGQVGYNYQLTRKDTVGVSYIFNAYRYSNFNQSINDNVVHISYGRRVTGRLAFQIAAGPEYTSFQTPITNTTVKGTMPSSSSSLYWSLTTSLTYQLKRTVLGLSYAHGVSGGSGVQAGAVTDTVSGFATRQLSRTFSGNWNLSYGRNNGLTVNAPGSTTTANQIFSYWSNNIGLNHSVGRTMNLSLNYLLQYQNSNSAFCVGPKCGSCFVVHQVLFSLGWHDHPIPF